MIIFISILIIIGIYQQVGCTIQNSIGPRFLSTISTKPKLYYNNKGVRLDCSAIGNPTPLLTWFRTDGNDEQSWIYVEPSEFIHLYQNGSLFIQPFQEYFKSIHAGAYICRAENAIGSIQTLPVQVKPQIYDTYEVEVKSPYGFEQSSVTISCEISPPSASSYVNVIGWLEKFNNQIIQLDLKPKTKYNILANKHLIIHNLSKSDDNRSYACIVNNDIENHTRQSRFKSLRVRNQSPFGPELYMKNNTEYQAQVGHIIELPCGITSLPPDTQISWWKDGLEIINIEEKLYSNSLILRILSSYDSGNYLCQIDDESIGRMTSTISLKVILPIECDINLQQKIVHAGSDTELICRINSLENSAIHWQWYHNSNLLPNKLNQYMIINATREHMGMYQCCYISTLPYLNSCCAQTQLQVINSPPYILTKNSQTDSNQIIILPENDTQNSIYLNFTIYADPFPDIKIFKDGQQLQRNYSIHYLPSGDILLDHVIYIFNISYTGLYEYLIQNSFGTISLSKHININRQKPYIQPLTNLTIRNGEQFTLTCYGSGQPNLQLQWIDQTNNQIVNSSSTSPILFTSKAIKSTFIYTCQAINSYGEMSSELFVAIEIPAKILSITSNQTVKINSKLKISCLAEGDNDLKLVLINPSSNKLNTIENKSDSKKKISVMIDNIQISHNGIYECYAKNKYSEDRRIFEIIVQTVPDKIENIFIEHSEQIFWMKPFDGNSKILKYILRIQSRQRLSWSNETIIIIDDSDVTNYRFESFFSKCTISVILHAVNSIGSSLPSEPIYFEANIKQFRIAPYNVTATNISSKSLILTWQYPLFHLCKEFFIEFVIEIIDQYSQTILKTHNDHSTVVTINRLKSFTYYTFVIYAVNELGPSPKSKPFKVKTLETVPLAMISDLTAALFNSSTAYVTWNFQQDDFQNLNGQFRTFAVTIYENFNMSTITTIETIKTNFILHNLHASSKYYISVAVCNYFDCGSSSAVIDIATPSSIFDMTTILINPINRPLILNCPYISNNSLNSPYPKLSETHSEYQCGSKLIHILYYDKPSSIRADIQYTTANEIGLKIVYPNEIIETVTITYKRKDIALVHEINISPPSTNVRLTNLSCGNTYEIMIYASNQAGFGGTEYIVTKTDGSIPSLDRPQDLIRSISKSYIILNMARWIINECPILSYEIEIIPLNNSNENNHNRYFLFNNELNEIKIDHLKFGHDYQLNVKVKSEPGENFEIISFRTAQNKNQTNVKYSQHFFLFALTMISFILTLLLIFTVLKICQNSLKSTETFISRNKALKPYKCSKNLNNTHQHHTIWSETEDEFSVENYTQKKRLNSFTSEDSQGNINPYAVTGETSNSKFKYNHECIWQDNQYNDCQLDNTNTHLSGTSLERYFRPIILESSSPNDQTILKPSPILQNTTKHSLTNILSTVSAPENKLFSTFIYASTSNPVAKTKSNKDHSLSSADSGVHSSCNQSPRCQSYNYSCNHSLLSNQDNPLYATYDETFSERINFDSYKRSKFSLV